MSEVQAEMVNFPSNSHTTPGYLAQPGKGGPYPGLVVIQEWWGLVPHIKDVAGRFAAEGFVALAPDLYHGQVAREPDEARKLAMEMDSKRAVQEIVAAVMYLQALPQVEPKKIGVVGWCMGGGLSLTSAAYSRDIGAVVAFYGIPRDQSVIPNIQAPVLGLYGEHDHGITPDLVSALDQQLTQQGVKHQFITYPGAEHAFFNDTRPGIYHPEAAKDAWQRTLDWFRQFLR